MPEPKINSEAQRAYEEAKTRITQRRLTGGEELDLHGLGLTALPPELGQLTALRELHLHNNQLTALPPELGQLRALTHLSLHNNQLTALPSEIGQLTALTVLRLYNNQLTALPPEFGQLTALTHLYLSDNQLTALPPEFGQLTALTVLHLYNNQLTALPPELGQLTVLKLLYLYNNQLTALSPELGQLTALTKLFLHGNPGLGLSPEVLGPTFDEFAGTKKATPAEPKAILDYYFEIQAQGTRPLNEVRLVLVGRGAAGKTSLVQRLVQDTFNPAQEETAGIALCDWTMRGCVGEPVTAHVWDFAGQVVTHSMHRYFLSHRTVYVLVLTQREDSASEDADYWLKLIKGYGMDKQDGKTVAGVIAPR